MFKDMNNIHSKLISPSKKVRTSIAAVFAMLCFLLVGSHSLIVKAQEKTLNGSTLEQQNQANLDLLTLQANEGDRDAQFKIGHLYLIGAGVERNENEALAWWLKAAEQEHPLAQFNVGRGYYLAIGLEKDDSKSKHWFQRAAMNNEQNAIETLVELGWEVPDKFNTVKKDSAEAVALASDENTPITSAASLDNPTDNIAPPTVTQAAVETGTPAVKHTKENNHSIAVFTNPNEGAMLISTLNTQANLVVIESQEEWTLVSNRSGLPVWVHQDFITTQNSSGTITGNKVNARSVPLIKNGTIVGRLNKGEKVRVLDQQKKWFRVMSPASFHAWVKTEDLQPKAKPRLNWP